VPALPDSAGASTAVVSHVDSYDEETYLVQPNETIESISDKKLSKKYAQALLLFNRNHPRPAPGLWKDPPVLQPGEPIYIPPAHILEKHYPQLLRDSKSLPPMVVAGESPSPAIAAVSPRGGPQYVVRKSEMIGAIAHDTLGSLDRWFDIYKLNGANFNPEQPLPVGTVLFMPPDARIPPENQPATANRTP
jgi:hypothetical protein